MDKIPESANGESIIFEMDLDIQEDVDACLAEFVFLVRLDLHEDARHLAEDILWRHIGYFPVFAELTAFFITIQDVQATSDLISDLAARRIVFAGIDEQEFLRMVDLFAQNRLSASTLAAFPQKEKLKLEGPDAVGALYSPFLEIDYSSIAQVSQMAGFCHKTRDSPLLHEKLPDVVEFATDYIQKLFEFRLLREATEIFLYLCIHLHNTGQKYDILSLYNNLSEWLEQRWKTSTTNNEIKDVLLTKKTVKTALFIAIRGKIQSPPVVGRFEDIDGLVQEIEELNNILFSMIADMKPSRSLSDSLHERWHVRKHPPLLREDVSIHPESPRILRSTLDNYGVWKAHPKRYDVERGGTRTPHLTLYFGNNEGIDFRAAINIKSGDQPESRLVYWVNEDMSGHPLVRGLSELKTGFERLDHKEPERGRLRLDYIRGNFFNVNTGRVLGHDITGPNNDIIDVLVPKVQQAINEGAVVYIFGERFNTNDGIHNVHMNQGNIRRYWGEDGVFQDGALLFHFPAADKWVGIFLAFASQAVHTSENGGHAISQVTWKDLLPGDLVKNPVASNSEPTPQGTDELGIL
ncbi:hypothetical protein EIK77_000136 [Talaromyces pinophilus]|nr:hypothetical protein EIK77_000136 [Talaromyces pinophilus]